MEMSLAGIRLPAVQLADQAPGGHLAVTILEDRGQLLPVDILYIKVDAEPTPVADVRGAEEATRRCPHQCLLRAVGCGAPQADAVVVVVIGGGGELFRSREPCRFAVAEPLGHARQPQAQSAHTFGRLGIGGSCDRVDASKVRDAAGQRRLEGSACSPRRRWQTMANMCRNITTLRGLEPPATTEEIEAAARQYVRKISGMTRPAVPSEDAFEHAVAAIAEVTAEILRDLPARRRPPRTVPPLRRPQVRARLA